MGSAVCSMVRLKAVWVRCGNSEEDLAVLFDALSLFLSCEAPFRFMDSLSACLPCHLPAFPTVAPSPGSTEGRTP